VTDVVLGVDLGTTHAKAAAFDASGAARGSAQREVPLASGTPGRAEQDPDALLAALEEAVREVLGGLSGQRVRAVACSTAMHSLLALDYGDRPLTRALTWADNRAAAQARELGALPGAGELARRTGTPISAMSPLAKLRWFRDEDPDAANRAARWVSMKDYLLLRLCGARAIDHSVASAMGLLDLDRLDWDDEALDLAGLRRDQLSTLVPTTAVVGGLGGEAAGRLGLEAGLPVVAGAADGCLENLGAGAVDPGVAAVTIGTSGAVRTMVDRPQGDPTNRLFCYALTPQRWVVGGPISNGGLVLRWARDRLFAELADQAEAEGRTPEERFGELAAAVPAGAGGLVCLPALVGERAPVWDPDLRGVLLGLTTDHGREHVLRALLEGVAYQLATVVEALQDNGHQLTTIHATGGFTASPQWLGIVAGVLDRPLAVPTAAGGATFGAAMLGLQALELADAVELARGAADPHHLVRPDPADRAAYRRTLDVFRDLGARLRPQFAALAELRAEARF
jgi:gluconokinase